MPLLRPFLAVAALILLGACAAPAPVPMVLPQAGGALPPPISLRAISSRWCACSNPYPKRNADGSP